MTSLGVRPGVTLKTGMSLPEPRLRGLCHVLRLTLPRYHGSNSRHLVEQFLECLLKNHPSSAGQLIATVLEVSREHRPLFITKNLARTCLTALSWSCKVASQVFVNKGDLKPDKMRDLVEAQANLLLSVVSACDATLNKKARRKMNYLWKQVTPEAYLEVLATLESSCPVLLSWCFLIGYLDAQKLRELIHSHKAKFLEVFRTAVLGSKTPAPTHVLEQSRSLLRHVTHDDFKGQLLPALQKAMLRNPEIIMESVAHVMQGVSLELSPYLGDLGKSIAPDDRTVHETVGGTPEDDFDSFALVDADISVVAPVTDAEIVGLVCGQGEDEEPLDEELREVPTTGETQNMLRLLGNKVKCGSGDDSLMRKPG
ncbi:hypothetical protein HPB47_021682 [Ixodes persulcatus]|uniref:Uncharacterized protein n=1 Tax=Ixodes persulcatus TaxID=34615 RepID=A0AC60QBT4_IXOPE|nr:hypothetical protein HPB47_021682 [Ixodes persulcatus]